MLRNLEKALVFSACATGALMSSVAAVAGPYSSEYVFGDSLSDNGNAAAGLHLTFPNPPSFDNSQTNGPVAVDLLAKSLGLPLNPSLWTTGVTGPGTNYAVAGATAAAQAVGGPPLINLPYQVGAFSAYVGGVANPSALYLIMIGGNDVRNAALQNTGLPAVQDGVNAELAAVSTLSAEGARDFLIVNVPDVGIIPEFAQDNPGDAMNATTYSQDYDSLLAAGLAKLDPTLPSGTALNEFDLLDFNKTLLAHAPSLGFTNTTDRCYTNTPFSAATSTECGPNAENIGGFVYWDQIHPTAKVHALWAQGFEEELGVAPVPEPSTWAAMMIGFAALGVAGYRRSCKAATSA